MDDPTFSAMVERATEPMPPELLTTTIDLVRQELVDDGWRRRPARGRLLGVSVGVAALAVLIAGVAIAFRDDGDRVVDSGPASTIATSTTSTPPPDADLPLTGAPLAEAPSSADCPPPYAPLVSVDQYSGSTAQLPVPAGQDVFDRGYRDPQVDSDGDGRPDEIVPKQTGFDPATIVRGDGTLTFERAGAELMVSVSGLPDLDGDGRDELGVGINADAQTGLPPLIGYYVVPGSTDPGTHDPADVGIRVARSVSPVPDRDGDGVDELVEYDAQSPTRILSGAAVGAIAAPGDARSVDPLLFVPGSLIGFAGLGGEASAVITGELERSPELAGIVRIATDEGVHTFTTSPEPWVAGYGPLIDVSRILISEQGTFVVVSQTDRTAARSYLWRLDAPCEPL